MSGFNFMATESQARDLTQVQCPSLICLAERKNLYSTGYILTNPCLSERDVIFSCNILGFIDSGMRGLLSLDSSIHTHGNTCPTVNISLRECKSCK